MNKFLIILFSISISGSILFLLFILLDKILPSHYVHWQLSALKSLLLLFLIPEFLIPYYYFSIHSYSFSLSKFEINNWIVSEQNIEKIINKQLYLLSCIIFLIWFLGFIFMLFISLIKSKKTFSLLIQTSKKIDITSINSLHLIQELKIKKNISMDYTHSPSITFPCILGVLHPVILLPQTTTKLSEKELELILMHELSHYKRKDCFFNYSIMIFLATHWFNPLIWKFRNKFHDFVEFSCDSFILKFLSQEEREIYSGLLLKLMNNPNNKFPLYNVTNLISRNEQFMKRRIFNIMKSYKKHNIISGFLILSLTLLTPITTYAASEQLSNIYNNILTEHPEPFPSFIPKEEHIVPESSTFSLEEKGIPPISDTLSPNYVIQSNSSFLKTGRTIDISVMNKYANGNFQIEIVLNSHTIVFKKSTDKTTAFLNYTTKQSGDYVIKIRNLSNNTIKINGTIEIN